NGIYDLTCNFKDEDGNIVYSCIESVNVFSGFTTDTWYSSSSSCKHLTDNKFEITDEVLASVTTSKTLSYPIILYDLDTKKKGVEFSDPKPGYSVFETVAEGTSVSDGLTLAKGKQISNFTIDPVDQTIFTLEMNAGGSFKSLMKYPSYAGYEVGTAKTLSGYSISSFCSYKGELYFYDSSSSTFYKLVDGKEPVALPLQSSGGSDITLDAYPILAVDGNYLYLAYGKYDSGYNYYYLYIEKYLISKSALTQVATVSKKMEELGIYGDDVDYPIEYQSKLSLSGIQVISGNVYLIVYERGNNNSNVCSRGGIIKITSTVSENGETHTLAFHDFKTSTETSDPSIWIYGWAYNAWHPVLASKASSTDCSDTNYFYGCTKFLAKKPEELVIADEGGYEYYDGGSKKSVNKNRVVTVNLQDFAMTSVDVNAGFDTYYSSSNCGFAGYNGSGY
ncbi:MAG: hypothetical protein IJR80_06230, partial [Treponema sp.]|nr:hypothetical protein [Treponema sp.]